MASPRVEGVHGEVTPHGPQGRELGGGIGGPVVRAGGGGPALGRQTQGEVHFQADGILDAQDPHDAGLGQREVREPEGGPGLEPDRGNGRANGYMVLSGANARGHRRAERVRWSAG